MAYDDLQDLDGEPIRPSLDELRARYGLSQAPEPNRSKTDSATGGDWSYFDDLHAVQAAEAKRGPYRRYQRPEYLGHDLTKSQFDVLLVLAQLSDMGILTPAISEIANRIGRHRDTVRRALRRLEECELIHTMHRPSNDPLHDLPNLYTVLPAGWLRLNRRPSGSDQMAYPPEKIRHPSDSLLKTDVTGLGGAPDGARLAALSRPHGRGQPTELEPDISNPESTPVCQQADKAASRAEQTRGESSKTAPPEPFSSPAEGSDVDLAYRAAKILDPTGTKNLRPVAAFGWLENHRRQHLGKFSSVAWTRAVQRLGWQTCLLAYAVTALRSRTATGREIQSRAAYLGGILRRGHEASPAKSLAALTQKRYI